MLANARSLVREKTAEIAGFQDCMAPSADSLKPDLRYKLAKRLAFFVRFRMMICDICKNPFTPARNETVCLVCAKAAWLATQPITSKRKPQYKDRKQTDICAVVRKNANGECLFMRLPPDYSENKISYIYTSSETTEEPMRIVSNFENKTTAIKNYFFIKIPQIADPITGTDQIVIGAHEIAQINNNKIILKDNSEIAVEFR